MRIGWLLVAVLLLSTPRGAQADFFVVTGVFESHAQAQFSAAEKGGWVLDTGSGVPPAVLASIFGEVAIEIEDRPGATNPCEPQEP